MRGLARAGTLDLVNVAEFLLLALALALVTLALWSYTAVRRANQRLIDVESRLQQQTVRDERTGLLNPKGMALIGTQILEIAKRDSDAVSACLIRLSPRSGAAFPDDDDVLTLAEAAVEVFRTGDAVSRLDTDTVLMVGKGTQIDPAAAHARLTQQMSRMLPPGDPLPIVTVGTGMLAPWEDGDLATLVERAQEDLNSRQSIS